jgi:alkylation response protein AidB-like acyl-CoA dehydrogenase
MDFDYTEEEEAFRHELREWLRENLPPGWTEGRREMMRDPDEREAFLRNWQRKLHEGGWAGIHWPEEYGGRGASHLKQVIYNEETSRVDAPKMLNVIGINLVGPTLMNIGTEYQKERFLSNMLSGEEIWCQGYSEPNSGSDLASLQTRAEKDGDRYRINGHKIWTSYAHLADWCFVLARTDDTDKKHEGITAFLVDMEDDGVSTEPIRQISDKREFNHTYFDEAVADVEHVVGDVGDGWNVAMTLSSYEHAISYAFEIERRWQEVVDYCTSHSRGGRPLSEDPHIRRRLAQLDAKVQANKLTYLRHVSEYMETGTPGPTGSMDRVYSAELLQELEDFATSIIGPEGGLWEDGPNDGQWVTDYLYSLSRTIAGGTSDIQRNIIGERALGLPRGFRE